MATKREVPYVADNLGISEADMDQGDCCSQFASGQDMMEGVSGRKKIDTTFENFSQDIVENPRSDWDDNVSLRGMRVSSSTDRKAAPVPMDLDRFPHRRY